MDDKDWKKTFVSIGRRERNNFNQFLLDSGLDVNALDKHGTTVLNYPAQCGNQRLVEFLVQKGADCDVSNSNGSKPLHTAAQYGHKDIVKFFLDIGIPVDTRDNDECTPLHYVAEKSTIDRQRCQKLVRLLVIRNADLNAVNRNGCTALLLAAQNGRKDIVELLIELGANLECCDQNRWTVLHHSIEKGWEGIVRFLLEGRFGVDLEARTSKGKTPLHFAAAKGWKDIVELLIKSGANFLSCDETGCLLLHYACEHGRLGLLKYIVNQEGCDLDAEDYTARTPLLLASARSHSSVVKYLVESGADVNCCDCYLVTPLHYACLYGWIEIVKSLTEKGCDVNAQNVRRNTPLYFAVKGRHLQVVEYLLNAGADCNLKNAEGETAFTLCIIGKLGLIGIALFLRNGAYFLANDYDTIIENLDLYFGILKNTEFCTLAVINYFNCVDLRKIYQIPLISVKLPAVEKLKIAIQSHVAQDLLESVDREIRTKGFCNILNVRPIVLKRLCVLSLVKHYNNLGIVEMNSM